jgi:hypothetical protein
MLIQPYKTAHTIFLFLVDEHHLSIFAALASNALANITILVALVYRYMYFCYFFFIYVQTSFPIY